MATPIPLAVVGAGSRGRLWLRVALAQSDFKLAAIVDPLPLARRRVAEQLPDLKVPIFDSIQEAAGRVEIQAAVITAWEDLRKQHCLEAFAAGWHVLAEKPFCLSLADARTVVEAGEKAGKIVSVVQNFRYMSTINAMQRLVAEGAIGAPGCAGFYRARQRNYVIGDRRPADLRHGYLFRQGVHDLDLIRYTLGVRPLRAAGISFRPPWGDYPGETTVTAVIEFERDVRVSYFGSWALRISDHLFRIDGTKGAIKVSGTDQTGASARVLELLGPEHKTWTEIEVPQDGMPGERFLPKADGLLLAELATAIRTGGITSTSGRDNLWTISTLDAIVRSTDAGGGMTELVDVSPVVAV